ncbi:hypothetical protein P9112_009708 [Eukaryota sp. TZLM1-RC]
MDDSSLLLHSDSSHCLDKAPDSDTSKESLQHVLPQWLWFPLSPLIYMCLSRFRRRKNLFLKSLVQSLNPYRSWQSYRKRVLLMTALPWLLFALFLVALLVVAGVLGSDITDPFGVVVITTFGCWVLHSVCFLVLLIMLLPCKLNFFLGKAIGHEYKEMRDALKTKGALITVPSNNYYWIPFGQLFFAVTNRTEAQKFRNHLATFSDRQLRCFNWNTALSILTFDAIITYYLVMEVFYTTTLDFCSPSAPVCGFYVFYVFILSNLLLLPIAIVETKLMGSLQLGKDEVHDNRVVRKALSKYFGEDEPESLV